MIRAKKSTLIHIVDKDSLDLGFQSLEDQPNQIMRQRTLLLYLIDGHVNRISDGRINVDDESLVIITQKNRTTVGSWHNSLY